MKRLFASQLTVSAWPFVILLPVELIFAVSFRQRQVEEPGQMVVLVTVLFGLLSVACAALAAAAWNYFARRKRWARTLVGSLVGYAVVTVASSLAIVLTGPALGWEQAAPTAFILLVPISRFPTVVLLAAIIDQVVDGVRARKELNGQLSSRLLQVRRMNALLEAAQRQVATESGRRLRSDVEQPLDELVARGEGMSDDELANAIEGFIDDQLRPLAHRLHPVSVRLGLIAALRALDPGMVIDVSDAIERLDVNGELLDDDVRLQVYRWVRQCREQGNASRVAIVMRARTLELSAFPMRLAPLLDPIQITAGLRLSGRGVVVAPLRGQSPNTADLVQHVRAEPDSERTRLSWVEILTTPLPGFLGVIALLSLSSFLAQLVVVPWPITGGAVITALAWVAAPMAVAGIFTLLPNPKATPWGAVWVVGQWLLIALSAAAAFALAADAFNLGPTLTESPGTNVFRAIYRYDLTGLALVVAYGIQVALHRRLAAANLHLDSEVVRQAEILADSRRLDQDVAEALHRNVQGRLAAAVVMIRLGQRDQAWVQVVAMADEEIPNLISRVDEASGIEESILPSPPDGLEVRESVRAPNIPMDLRTDLRRAVSEIAVNAVRHGGATSFEVTITQVGDVVSVQCRDNGRGLVGDSVAGLGSRVLDEISARWGGSWSLSSSQSGCVVELDARISATKEVVSASKR